MDEKIIPYSFNSSWKVVVIDILSKTISTATFVNLFCSFNEIPNFSNVFNNSGSISLKSFIFVCFLGAE